MPYKKGSLAEQTGKLRRKIKRRIARFQKEIDKTDSAKEKVFFNSEIKKLTEEMERTYQRNPLTHKATGYDKDDIRIAVQNLRRQEAATRIGTSNQVRKNLMTQEELNAALSVRAIGPSLSEFTREEVNIFYASTKNAWDRLPSTANRNEAIMKYYFGKQGWKKQDFRKFIKFILSKNKEAVDKAMESNLPLYDDEGRVPTKTDQNEYYQNYIARIEPINRALFDIIKEEYEDFDPDEE